MFYLSAVSDPPTADPSPGVVQASSANGSTANAPVTSNNNNTPSSSAKTSNNMSQVKNPSPSLEQLEDTLEQSGLLLTKKNVARDEDFVIEVQEVFNVGYLPLHSLLALPVCWASARILPAPNRPRNMDLFDEEDSLDIAVVLAFPKAAKNLRTPAIIDVHRCSRMSLPPSKSGDQAEDALLVFSWSCDQDSNVTLEKSGPDKYKPTTL